MRKIKKQSLKEIRKRSKDYLAKAKRKKISGTDLLMAEKLTGIGYQIAVDEFKKQEAEKRQQQKEKKKIRRKILPKFRNR